MHSSVTATSTCLSTVRATVYCSALTGLGFFFLAGFASVTTGNACSACDFNALSMLGMLIFVLSGLASVLFEMFELRRDCARSRS